VAEPYAVAAGEIWHFDFYRFSDPREWEDAGFRDIFASNGLKLCEWSENAAGVMPRPDLELRIDVDDQEHRLVKLTALTPCGQALLP
jgi:tRNA threonylcarbamoyladenosine biosynthesis protein TsaE